MKYAWYVDFEYEGRELVSIENRPMDVNDAIQLTIANKAITACSYPAFKLKNIQVRNIDFEDNFDLDGIHSIFDEIIFESYNSRETYKTENYMIIPDEEMAKKYEIPETIKDLYTKEIIKSVYATSWSVTYTGKGPKGNQEKYMLSEGRNFENKNIQKKLNINDEEYKTLQNFSQKLVEAKREYNL